MSNWAELKAKALAATPGPWCAQAKDRAVFTTWGQPDNWVALARKDEDCEFIAAANPAVLLALIAERDALEAELRSLKSYLAQRKQEFGEQISRAQALALLGVLK
jgi:hypothetical protein